MGDIFGKALRQNMEDQLKKTQEFMISQGKINFDRQCILQAEMFRKQAAMSVSRAQDTAIWFTSFTIIAGSGLIIGSLKKKNPAFLTPILPFFFLSAYWTDMGYFTKMERISLKAETLLRDHKTISLPCGPLDIKQIDVIIDKKSKAVNNLNFK